MVVLVSAAAPAGAAGAAVVVAVGQSLRSADKRQPIILTNADVVLDFGVMGRSEVTCGEGRQWLR